jgi:hypothetical protein
MLTIKQILEWMYPFNMNVATLDWKRRAIWNWVWVRGADSNLNSVADFTTAMNLLHPLECDASKLTGRERELWEARRQIDARRHEETTRYYAMRKAA